MQRTCSREIFSFSSFFFCFLHYYIALQCFNMLCEEEIYAFNLKNFYFFSILRNFHFFRFFSLAKGILYVELFFFLLIILRLLQLVVAASCSCLKGLVISCKCCTTCCLLPAITKRRKKNLLHSKVLLHFFLF